MKAMFLEKAVKIHSATNAKSFLSSVSVSALSKTG
jgi:hypothetical protein